jgi:hypothetical protein
MESRSPALPLSGGMGAAAAALWGLSNIRRHGSRRCCFMGPLQYPAAWEPPLLLYGASPLSGGMGAASAPS